MFIILVAQESQRSVSGLPVVKSLAMDVVRLAYVHECPPVFNLIQTRQRKTESSPRDGDADGAQRGRRNLPHLVARQARQHQAAAHHAAQARNAGRPDGMVELLAPASTDYCRYMNALPRSVFPSTAEHPPGHCRQSSAASPRRPRRPHDRAWVRTLQKLLCPW